MRTFPAGRRTAFFALFLAFFPLYGWAMDRVSVPAGRVPGWRAPSQACGTGALTRERARLLNLRPRSSDKHLKAAGSRIRTEDGVFIIRANETELAADHPLDLVNSSVVFTRTGTDSYSASRVPLQYDEDRGSKLASFDDPAAPFYVSYELQNFGFTFRDQEYRTVYLSALNGISFTEPEPDFAEQLDTLEIASYETPVLSPLLLTASIPFQLALPNLYVRESADRLLITWESLPVEQFGYEVQAALHRNGDVTFSYRSITNVNWGTLVLTPGRAAWQVPAQLLTRSDPAGDLPPETLPEIAPMIDLRSYTLNRISDSELLELRIKVAGPIDPAMIPEDDPLLFLLAIYDPEDPTSEDFDVFAVEIFNDGATLLFTPERVILDSAAVRIENDELIFGFLQSSLIAPQPATFQVLSGLITSEEFSDSAQTSISLGPAARKLTADFSTAANTTLTGIGVEAFTLPALDIISVWDGLKSSFGLSDHSVDALALYQTFFTDIVFYAAAFAAGGNPQADGVADRDGYGLSVDRSPTILHMNELNFGRNEDARHSGHVLLHEFGHRWLYSPQIKEGEALTHSLNPRGEHPAEYVHTPAAFPVYSVNDASVMGGANFIDHADGTFSTRPETTNFGYSWTDLYLMGLARPEEVEPWYYIADSTLGPEYYPPSNITVTGTRRDVGIQQVIDGMGPRTPGYDASQKNFRVYFVLLTRTDPTPAQMAALREHRRALEDNFRIATAGRGSVNTTYAPPPRTRPARR